MTPSNWRLTTSLANQVKFVFLIPKSINNLLRLISLQTLEFVAFWMAQIDTFKPQHTAANPSAAGSTPVVARPMVVGFACWLSH